ncbi:MAG: hypothetical protein LWX56_02600 [Ignavibacteria bacterium]|nr:hypothetical protein [Ignavibacteria bacterium]
MTNVLTAQEKIQTDVFRLKERSSVLYLDMPLTTFPDSISRMSLNEFQMMLSYQSRMNLDYRLFAEPEDSLGLSKKEISALFRFSVQHEDSTLARARKYLGISRDVFAFILAIMHLVKYH